MVWGGKYENTQLGKVISCMHNLTVTIRIQRKGKKNTIYATL